jgi:rod shape-determining protein MreC
MQSFWKNRPLLITIVTLVVLFVLMIITAGQEDVTGAKSLIGGVLEPIQGFFYDATDGIATFFAGLFTTNDLAKVNADLSEQLADLKGQLGDYEELKQENTRLKAALDYTEQNKQYKFVMARVTGRSLGQWFITFSINKGVSDGIRKDCPVVTQDGLVGRVIQTGATWSQIMAIIDGDSNVPGLVERTRDNGILEGSDAADGAATLKMQNLPLDADLMPQDKIITSGLGGVYPKGLVIGEITKVDRSGEKNSMQKSATVKPAVDFLHLEEVMVIVEDKTAEAAK